ERFQTSLLELPYFIPLPSFPLFHPPPLPANSICCTPSPSSWLQNLSEFFDFTIQKPVYSNLSSIFDTPSSLIFYTDGSLRLSPPHLPIAQAGVFCLNPPVSFNFSIPSGNHSSLCSELWGVLLALAVSPPHAHIIIFCDSRNVSQSYSRLFSSSLRKIFRSPCSIECLLIKHILHSRCLSLCIHWIKGHSGNPFNTVSDALATSPNTRYTFSIKQTFLASISLPQAFNIPLNSDAHSFIEL
ncbi:hypothetical protein HMI56_005356, partial [Coelomomyces lativittatus]